MRLAFILACAFALDLLFGDPLWLPHPVCLIGNMISSMEKLLRKICRNEFAGGMVLSLVVVSASWTVPFAIVFMAGKLGGTLALIIEIYMCYQILAAKSLYQESMKVYRPLVEGNIPEARRFLSRIVGRDTENLDAEGIIKATVETVAENTTDGVMAPLLFMALGGAPLGFLYKAINTMDSMIGYTDEKYLLFGKFAARLDDAANFIPARISAALMILSAFVLGMDAKNAARIYARDRKNHKSPNSAQTESVCAGALGIQLAGDATYGGVLTKKPTIGDGINAIGPADIIRANRLMIATAVAGLLLVCAVRVLVR